MRIGFPLILALVIVVNILTFAPQPVRVDALHTMYCWGKVNALTPGC